MKRCDWAEKKPEKREEWEKEKRAISSVFVSKSYLPRKERIEGEGTRGEERKHSDPARSWFLGQKIEGKKKLLKKREKEKRGERTGAAFHIGSSAANSISSGGRGNEKRVEKKKKKKKKKKKGGQYRQSS